MCVSEQVNIIDSQMKCKQQIYLCIQKNKEKEWTMSIDGESGKELNAMKCDSTFAVIFYLSFSQFSRSAKHINETVMEFDSFDPSKRTLAINLIW